MPYYCTRTHMLSIPYDWHADEPQTAYARRMDSTAQHRRKKIARIRKKGNRAHRHGSNGPAATQSSGCRSVLPIEASRTRRQASSECLQTLPKSCMMMMVCRGSHRVSSANPLPPADPASSILGTPAMLHSVLLARSLEHAYRFYGACLYK